MTTPPQPSLFPLSLTFQKRRKGKESWKENEYSPGCRLIFKQMKQKMKVHQNQKRTALADGYTNKEINRTTNTRNLTKIVFCNIVDKIRV